MLCLVRWLHREVELLRGGRRLDHINPSVVAPEIRSDVDELTSLVKPPQKRLERDDLPNATSIWLAAQQGTD